MQTQNKFARLAVLVILGSLGLSLSTLATAETDAAQAIRASAANVPTNIPGVYTYAEPPKEFNPVTAADVDLATYGFPPRPDKQGNPDGYAVWERVMKAAKIHWNGELKPLPNHGHEMIRAGSSPMSQTAQPQVTGPQQIATINTSGVVLTNKQTKWTKNSFDAVYATFSVPTPALPYGITCSPPSSYGVGAEEYSLVGIDGLFVSDGVEGANPAFEAGLAGGVYELSGCGQGEAAALAVFGYFFPGYSGLRYAAFNPNIGDVFFADVFATGPNTTYVYLSDLTTYTAAEYAVSTPGLIGQNVAWMVSRSCCDNDNLYGTNQLANTANVFFQGYAATANESANGKFTYYPGSQAASTRILTMTDDQGDQPIETVTQGSAGNEGLHALLFTTVNCAYSGGCTP
jgi:hypothetical protein